MATGMPEGGPALSEVYSVANNEGLGDRFLIQVYDENENLVAEIDSWEESVFHEGVTMPAGSPLVAGSHGSGKIRATPDLRRSAMIFGSAMEYGEPVAYARHYFTEPYEELGGQPVNILMMPTVGDTIVSFSAGITLARVAGLIPQGVVDDRYGMTVDQWLVERRVIQGLEEFGPYVCNDGNPCLFDPDDLDEGKDETGAPSDAPMRLMTQTSRGESGLRIPYVLTTGSHGVTTPQIGAPFDISSFAINQITGYFLTEGKEISDDHCMEDYSCDWLPPLEALQGNE